MTTTLRLTAGTLGLAIFIFSLLVAMASPVAAGDVDSACWPRDHFFAPCSQLDTSRVDDFRGDVALGA